MKIHLPPAVVALGSTLALAAQPLAAQVPSHPGTVLDADQIATSGKVPIQAGDQFGWSIAYMVDIDGDGNREIAVGAPRDDQMGTNAGAVYLLSLDNNNLILESHKLVLAGEQAPGDLFGHAVANIGDLDGDGVPELAVGAPGEDTNGSDTGAVYILHLMTDGTVASFNKIAYQTGGFTGVVETQDEFGFAVAGIGDLNGDQIPDMAVGAPGDQDGIPLAPDNGAVYVLFLGTTGVVLDDAKISNTSGGFTNVLDEDDRFGCSVAVLGDLNGDTRNEIAVGALGTEDALMPVNSGAVWTVFLFSDGSVLKKSRIAAGDLAPGTLTGSDGFGVSVAGIGDIDRDRVPDLAVAVEREGFVPSGAVWILQLNPDGGLETVTTGTPPNITVTHMQMKLASPQLAGVNAADKFGRGLGALGISFINSVRNPGFEGGSANPAWVQASTNFGTPLCNSSCNVVPGSGPRTDQWFVRFGAKLGKREQASVSQAVPIRSDILTFYVHNPISSGKTTGILDSFTVKVDNSVKFQIFEGNPLYSGGYTQVRLDVSQYNDGNLHVVRFEADTSGFLQAAMPAIEGRTDFLLDDVLLFETPRVGPFGLIVGAPNDDDMGLDAGALWSLSLEGPLGAAFVKRAGTVTPLNPSLYNTTADPVIGFLWSATVTRLSSNPTKTYPMTAILGFARPSQGFVIDLNGNMAPPSFGELLVDLSSDELFVDIKSAPNMNPPMELTHSFQVPNNLAIVGYTFSTQGFRFGGTGTSTPELLNAIDLTLGH